MHIPSTSYSVAYSHILSRARGSPACTTYLFVAPDVDALCAARLLSGMLKTDDVAHQTVPVGSWVQLHEEALQLRDEDVRCPFPLFLEEAAEDTGHSLTSPPSRRSATSS
jgi:cell division control protein 45